MDARYSGYRINISNILSNVSILTLGFFAKLGIRKNEVRENLVCEGVNGVYREAGFGHYLYREAGFAS
jgi:hypothetical protein